MCKCQKEIPFVHKVRVVFVRVQQFKREDKSIISLVHIHQQCLLPPILQHNLIRELYFIYVKPNCLQKKKKSVECFAESGWSSSDHQKGQADVQSFSWT